MVWNNLMADIMMVFWFLSEFLSLDLNPKNKKWASSESESGDLNRGTTMKYEQERKRGD